jgi:hypothetical protein
MTGKMKHPLYFVWRSMIDRCKNKNNPAFHRYGGRGISMCDRWKDFHAFVEDMGERPDGFTLERENNNGNYEPSNCKWASRKEQQLNRSNTSFVEIEGVRHRVWDLAQQCGLKPDTVLARAKNGLTLQEVLSPARKVYTEGLRLGGIANGERNKAKTHCKFGHEYTPANTAPNGKNGRKCRRCHADRQLRRTAAKRQASLEG